MKCNTSQLHVCKWQSSGCTLSVRVLTQLRIKQNLHTRMNYHHIDTSGLRRHGTISSTFSKFSGKKSYALYSLQPTFDVKQNSVSKM